MVKEGYGCITGRQPHDLGKVSGTQPGGLLSKWSCGCPRCSAPSSCSFPLPLSFTGHRCHMTPQQSLGTTITTEIVDPTDTVQATERVHPTGKVRSTDKAHQTEDTVHPTEEIQPTRMDHQTDAVHPTERPHPTDIVHHMGAVYTMHIIHPPEIVHSTIPVKALLRVHAAGTIRISTIAPRT